MLSRTLGQTVLKIGGVRPQNVRWMSSLNVPPRKEKEEKSRGFHSSAPKFSDAAAETTSSVAKTSSIMDRFVVMTEATVSKIFPAGFGWQTASIIADGRGMDPANLDFALTTGLGDAIAVLCGHFIYYSAKKAVTGNESMSYSTEFQNGVLLASAAFCSGTAWQPAVNALQGAGFSFNAVAGGTMVACGMAFYGGLRVGRTMLPLPAVEGPNFENSCTDAALSTAIGGATACFVGTDIAYLPEQNWMAGAVGIADGTPDLTGCAIAGTSTALGFCVVQSGLNIAYPAGKCWND